MSFTLTFSITSQPHTLTHASQYIHLTASHPHTSQYITNPFTASHPHTFMYESTIPTASHTSRSVHSPLLHSLTHVSQYIPPSHHSLTPSHISVHFPLLHTLTPSHMYLSTFPHHVTPSHIWVIDGCVWQFHTLHTTLFKFTLCQPANQPSRNSVTCSCRLQAHTLPTHTLHTLTPSHSRGSVEESLILQYMTINNSQLALKCKY